MKRTLLTSKNTFDNIDTCEAGDTGLDDIVNNRDYSDIIFYLEDENVRIYAHRVIICASQNYLERMLRSHMLESELKEIPIRGITQEVFIFILQYIYGLYIDIPPMIVLDIFMISDLYLLDNLKSICEVILLQGLDDDNVIAIKKHTELLSSQMKAGCGAYIKKFWRKFSTHPDITEQEAHVFNTFVQRRRQWFIEQDQELRRNMQNILGYSSYYNSINAYMAPIWMVYNTKNYDGSSIDTLNFVP